MQDIPDSELLRRFRHNESDEAFSELVRRHINLVYSVARRHTENAHHAQEITQAVFIILVRKAASLGSETVLSGWLYHTARLTAANFRRAEMCHVRREQEAYVQSTLEESSPDAVWRELAPFLDEAMSHLDPTDRDAVVLRYFENQDLRAVGTALGISDDAAQKRVSRAIERLREFFTKRGVTVGASGLTVAITANAAQAAPVGLAATVTAAAVLTGTTLTTAAAASVTKAIAMTTMQKTLIAATLVAAIGTGIYEARQSAQLREENQSLRQQQAHLAEQNEELSRERDDATRQLAALRDDNARLNQNTAELMRLRGEVAALRRQSSELDSLRKENAQILQRAQSQVASNEETNKLPVVAKITVTRVAQPRLLSEELVRTNISVKQGDIFDRDAVDRDVRDLFATGLFRNVLVKEHKVAKGIVLEYIVQEKPKLTRIRFAGNNHYRDTDLNKLLESKVGEALDDRRIYGEARRIEDLYAKSGFTSTRVKSVLNINEDIGEGDVVFEISE